MDKEKLERANALSAKLETELGYNSVVNAKHTELCRRKDDVVSVFVEGVEFKGCNIHLLCAATVDSVNKSDVRKKELLSEFSRL